MSERKIEVYSEVWLWSIGKESAVIKSPKGKKTVIPIHKIKNIPKIDFDEARKDGRKKGAIKPSEIRAYIESYLA